MCLTFTGYLKLGFIFLLFLPLFGNGHKCSEGFFLEAERMNISQNCKIKTLGAEFGWNYNDRSRRLDIAFGAKLDGEMGWLAWGLNPQGPHMVGTRALIGIKHKNDSLEFHQYNITDATRLGCQLLPIDDLGLDIRNFSFFYLEAIHYYMIKATVFLPLGYNSSRTNIVWQIGYAVADKEPKMHPTSLKNFDCAETIDLNSNQTITYKAHSRRNLRMAHGILNVMGWGIFLPVGVIIARYFRNFPKYWGLWYVFHTTCQIAAYILGSAGWVLGLWLGKQSKYYCYRTHGIFGIVIFTFTTIQMFALRLKPKRTDPYRDYWNMYHHFLGYALLTLISINIFKGIAILKPEDTWKWTYIGVLGFLGTTALAFEVYTWTKFVLERKSQNQKGGKNPPTDQNASKSKTAQPQGSAGTGTSVQPPTNLNL